MRIAMFMPSLGPASLGWKVHLDFADAVRRRGHDFELLTTLPPNENNPQEVPDGDSSGPAADTVARVLPVPAGWQRVAEPARPLLRTRQLLPAAGALAVYLREHGDAIDLLHLEVAYPHAAAAQIATTIAGWGGPTAVTPMGEDVLVVPDRAYGLRRYAAPRYLVRRTLRRATMLRCLSPMFERHIAAIAPHTLRRVIPLSISAEAAAVARMSGDKRREWRREARAEIDAEWGTAGRPFVLSLGRLHPFKGVDLLIDAAASFADATVLIVGPSLNARPFGDMKTALESHAAYRGVTDKVRLVGGIPAARALATIAAADPADARVSTLEIFGPVVCVYGYEDIDKAIRQANALPVAFQTAVFTDDVDIANRMFKQLDATAVMINDHTAFRDDVMPFAGLRESGLGIGGIPYTMEDMQIDKMMVIKSTEL